MKEADPKSKDEIDGYKKNIESANDEIKELDQKIAVLKQ